MTKKTPGGQLGGIPPEGSDEAGKLPARIDRYSTARARAIQMVEHLGTLSDDCIAGAAKARTLLDGCGNYLLFHHYYTVGKVRLAAMRSCKQHLLCPLCAIRRGAKTLQAYLARYEVVAAQRPDARPYMVTFAIRNGDDLAERFSHLTRSIKRLHNRRRLWNKGTRGAAWTESARAQAAVWSYEVTNRGNGWHPHVHMVWLCVSEPSQAALRREWEAITGDSWTVDVRPIEGDDMANGFMEVLKYALKFSDLSLSDNVEAWETLRGRRLLGSHGLFRGVQVPEEMTDELLDDLPYLELFYQYVHGHYVLTSWSEEHPDQCTEGGGVDVSPAPRGGDPSTPDPGPCPPGSCCREPPPPS